MHDNTQHLYNNLDLRKLLIPIIVEQLLSSLMGTADTMMVSNVGSAAISAVSLVYALPPVEWAKGSFSLQRKAKTVCIVSNFILHHPRRRCKRACQKQKRIE